MPPSPQILRHNGGTAPHFHSTVSVQKLRRLSTLILVLRLASFCFALASAVFMATARSDSANWVDYDAFRFVVAANAIVAVYSFVEMWVSVWEILKGGTLLPEAVQVWFDFGHDQPLQLRIEPDDGLDFTYTTGGAQEYLGFAYLLLSANAAGTSLARTMRGGDTCTAASAFCVQSYISISLGFAAFLFLLVSSLFSGFRVACFLITGSRFHL